MAISSSSTSTKEKGLARRSLGEGGFTLIELLVVMGITVALTAMVLGYSRQSSSQLALASTESKMLSLINRAKFLSIETYFGGGRSGSGQRICAYGVRVDIARQEMFIFQDLSSEGKCPSSSGGDAYDEGERLTGELNEIKLENALMAFGESDLSEVIFIPPDPKTKINKSGTTEKAKLSVKIKEGSGQFVITVNNAGQIKAE